MTLMTDEVDHHAILHREIQVLISSELHQQATYHQCDNFERKLDHQFQMNDHENVYCDASFVLLVDSQLGQLCSASTDPNEIEGNDQARVHLGTCSCLRNQPVSK